VIPGTDFQWLLVFVGLPVLAAVTRLACFLLEKGVPHGKEN
jgi:hypothetical protein